MADNMCGPSTALKSFSNHVNRDNSLHQDRTVAGPSRNGLSDFRSRPAGNSNEAGVQAFLNSAPSLEMQMDMQGPPMFQQMGPHPGMPHAGPGVPAMPPPAMNQMGPMIPHGATMAQGNNWASEFTAMQQQSNNGGAAPGALVAASRAPFMQQQQPYSSMHMYNNYSPMMNRGFMPQSGFQMTAPAPMMTAATTAAPVTSSVPGISETDLNARFDQIEKDMEFSDYMDDWMAVHGPNASEREDVEAIMEAMADKMDAQKLEDDAVTSNVTAEPASRIAEGLPTEVEEARQEEGENPHSEQDDLARTAEQIVNTLDSHPSERFHNSAFVGLMRRIQNREVTVQGDILLDRATGQPVAGSAPHVEVAPTTVPTPSASSEGQQPSVA